MTDSIEEILAKEPHFVRIEPAEKWDFPKINYSLWERKERPEAREYITYLQEILNRPYLLDDFNDHHKRREWHKEVKKKNDGFFAYVTTTALTGSSVMGLLNFSKFIQKGYRGNATKLKEMVQEIEDLQHKEFCSGKDYYHREYDLKTAEEKVKFVKECKQKVYDIILFISEDETPFQRRFNQLIDCLYSSGE